MNYVDLFIFTNLAVVNALSLYLFVHGKINAEQNPIPLWPFVIQYILVFLPLLYMMLYMSWYLLTPSQKETLIKLAKMPARRLRKIKKDKYLRTTLLGPSEGVTNTTKDTESTDIEHEATTTEISVFSDNRGVESEAEASESGSDNDDDGGLESMLKRAQTQNTYQTNTDHSSLVTPYQQWVQGAKKEAVTARGLGTASAPQHWKDLSVSGFGSRRETSSSDVAELTASSRPLSPRHGLENYGSIANNHAQAEL